LEPLAILPTDPERAKHLVELFGSRVTYYEFGNENNYFNGWSGETYANAWKAALPGIRQANPNAKVGGPVVSHISSSGSAYISDFLDNVKGQPDVYPDFISFHLYAEYGEDESNSSILTDVATWGARVDWIRNTTISKLGKNLPIACTEWNWDAVPENTGDDRDKDAQFMHDFSFAVLNQWQSHGVFLSAQYGYGAGMGGDHLTMVSSSGSPKPQFTAFREYKQLSGL
jgi:hypothetical protein